MTRCGQRPGCDCGASRRADQRTRHRPGHGGGDPAPGQVTRDDVAAVLAAVLDSPSTIGRTFDLTGGNTAVAEAVAGL